ncbi:MAG: sigma-70 family RNA polymerase sigma factor [Hymenobacteraceae bacterium]|nr:sigma-70 family RNA polymerase sigma factor [Hymenobacteraceae bacterium]
MPPVAAVAVAVGDALLARCRRGEPAAQEQIYRLLAPRLLVVARRYSRSDADAEDALQRAMLNILTRLDQWKQQGPFEAWARRVTVNTALDGWRRAEPRTITDLWGDDAPDLPSAEPSALDQLSADDLIVLLDTLPPGYRTVLNLYAIEGYSHSEIAALLGIAEGTSKSQLARARALLAKKLTVTAAIAVSVR